MSDRYSFKVAAIRYDGRGLFTCLELITPATVTTTRTVLASEGHLLLNSTGGIFTVTLPAASSVPAGHCVLMSKANAANTITVAAAGADTIEGAASITLVNQYTKALLVSDGSALWYRYV